MAIILRLNNKISSQNLVLDIRNKIDNGQIDTWLYDKDGDFTHSADQWKNKAWMSPNIFESNPQFIVFGILGRKGTDLSMDEYSIYHGRFTEMLLKQYSQYIVKLEVTTPKDERVSEYDTFNVNF